MAAMVFKTSCVATWRSKSRLGAACWGHGLFNLLWSGFLPPRNSLLTGAMLNYLLYNLWAKVYGTWYEMVTWRSCEKWSQPGFQKQLECRISVELGSFTEFKRGHLKVTSLSSFVIVFCCTSIEFEHWTGFNLPQWTCRTWLIVDQADQAFFSPFLSDLTSFRSRSTFGSAFLILVSSSSRPPLNRHGNWMILESW